MSGLILYDGANLLGDVFDENWCLIILTTYIQCMYKQHIESLLDHLNSLIYKSLTEKRTLPIDTVWYRCSLLRVYRTDSIVVAMLYIYYAFTGQ